MLLSEIAYKYKCDSKTKHYFKIGICEYLGISPLHPVCTTESTELKLKIMESSVSRLFLKVDTSLPLEPF